MRRTIVNGIRGFGSKRKRCEQEGRKLRRTGKESRSARIRKKLLGRTNWYKKKPKEDLYNKVGEGMRKINHQKTATVGRHKEKKTVIFVEQTVKGELASQLRELFLRLERITGFGIKVVERAGATVKSKLPTSLGDGVPCGRTDCVPCNQGAEFIHPCTRTSVLYENVCLLCNPTAGTKEELGEIRMDIPTMYVGESSRSLKERGGVNWTTYRGKGKESHTLKHHILQHNEEGVPRFVLRAVSSHKTALDHQVSETVRIKQRGEEGALLNSKS